MQLYIDCAAEIHGVFLKHFAPQDIFTYSIDESFIDATPYLKMYNIPTRELAKRVIDDVHDTVGTISTCGIGTNMFLAKVALDPESVSRCTGIHLGHHEKAPVCRNAYCG